MTPPDASAGDRSARELELIDDLRGVASRVDPMPASVLAAASAAFGMRDLDAQLAALVADSLAEDGLDLVRGSGATRMMAFEAPGLVIQLQVTGAGESRRLVGQVVGSDAPDATYEVQVEHPGGLLRVVPDEHGRFLLEGVPSGNVRLRVAGAGQRSVITAWVTV